MKRIICLFRKHCWGVAGCYKFCGRCFGNRMLTATELAFIKKRDIL